MDTLLNLGKELTAFCDAYSLPRQSADELSFDITSGTDILSDLEELQVDYLANFGQRWDLAVAGEDVMCAAGIWTPWAQVLCAACNNGLDTMQNVAKHIEPFTGSYHGDCVFQCDDCGCNIGFEHEREIVDLLRLRDAVVMKGGNAQMEQTGGMCMALVQYHDEGRFAYVATCMDSEDGEYALGLFDCEGQLGDWGGEADCYRSIEVANLDRAVRFFDQDETDTEKNEG